MPFEIRYSPRSKSDLDKIIEYVSTEFGISKAFEVHDYYLKIINHIAYNPNQFPLFEKGKNIRYCVIRSQTTLYYRFKNEIVELISFRCNWMNPKTKKL